MKLREFLDKINTLMIENPDVLDQNVKIRNSNYFSRDFDVDDVIEDGNSRELTIIII